MTNEMIVQAIRSGAGDRCALMEQLYKQNEGIIRKMANKAAFGSDLFDDLMQEGYFALETAVNGFDLSAGVQFVSYFGTVLKWRFWGFQRAAGLPVSVPAYLLDRIARYKATKAALEMEHGAAVQPAAVAVAMGLDEKQAAEVELLLYQLRVVRLDEPIDEDGEVCAGDLIPDADDPVSDLCDDAERDFILRLLDDAMQRDLDETERAILCRYCGGEHIQNIADDFGLQYQQVVNVQNKAIRKLRSDMRLRVEFAKSNDLYHYGLQRFKNSQMSSVEFIAEQHEKRCGGL